VGYRLSPLAQADLDDIWNYSFEQWGLDQAETYIRDIRAAIEAAAERGAKGRRCDDIRPGYFKRAAGSHMMFYRLVDADIEIVRILHGRMDFDSHLD
jgi:toxin ParE1/3/4